LRLLLWFVAGSWWWWMRLWLQVVVVVDRMRCGSHSTSFWVPRPGLSGHGYFIPYSFWLFVA
jgi:hypothetical protein